MTPPSGHPGRLGWTVLLLLLPLLCGFEPFRSRNSEVQQGNEKLKSGKVKEALKLYDQAAKELPDDKGVHYNRGIALYRLGKFDEARQALSRATGSQDRSLKKRAFYNMGNALYQQKKYKDAVDAYRHALRVDPNHRPSKWNLELALRKIREEEKKKKQDEKKKKDNKQDQKNKDNKSNNQKQSDDKKQQDNKQQDDKKQQQKQQQKKKQKKDKQSNKQKQQQKQQQRKRAKQAPPKQQQMRRALDALDKSDKNLQRRRLRLLYGGGRRRPPDKDW
jgi:tetratricopeptide (TPR) repeat protein